MLNDNHKSIVFAGDKGENNGKLHSYNNVDFTFKLPKSGLDVLTLFCRVLCLAASEEYRTHI